MIRGIYRNHGPYSRLFIFVGLLLTGFGLSTILGFLSLQFLFGLPVFQNPAILTNFSDPYVVDALKFLQLFNSIGVFFFPVLFYAVAVSGDFRTYLSIGKLPRLGFILLTILAMISALPLVNYLAELNEQLDLPASLQAIETWMHEKEDAASDITDIFLVMKSPAAFLYNLIVIGLVPAIGEELLFRSFLQKRIAVRLGLHAGVWISAFLFSAIHLQFFGFIPRFLLGALFGYLFVWSGTLWIPVLAHFVNNAGAVAVQYYFGKEYTEDMIDRIGLKEGHFIYLLASAALLSFILYKSYRLSVRQQ